MSRSRKAEPASKTSAMVGVPPNTSGNVTAVKNTKKERERESEVSPSAGLVLFSRADLQYFKVLINFL